MFIQTEATPNPNALKFLPGRDVAPQAVLEYRTIDEAVASPLAEALFELEGVEGVFFGADYVSVTRAAQGPDWSEMKAPILSVIMDHFVSGAPLVRAGEAVSEDAGEDTDPVRPFRRGNRRAASADARRLRGLPLLLRDPEGRGRADDAPLRPRSDQRRTGAVSAALFHMKHSSDGAPSGMMAS